MSSETRRALLCRALSDDLSGLAVEQLPLQQPGPGQVLVRVRAAALNFPDYLMSSGGYQHKPDLPFVPGLEGAGEVQALGGGVAGLAVGQRVSFGAIGLASGSMTTHSLLDAQHVQPLDEGVSFEEGAAYRTAFSTAWAGLVEVGRLREGEAALIHGATGGVGMAAVKLAKHLGATAIATGTSPQKLQHALRWGADHVLETGGGFRDRVKELTGGQGAHLAYDPVGGDVFDESLRALRWGGRIVVVGFADGRIPQAPANLVLIKQLSVLGLRAGEMGRRDPEAGARIQAGVQRMVAAGIRPEIGASYDLDDALDAFRAIERREVLGKIVIRTG